MTESQTGAMIESGLADWQILQQDATGFAALTLRGRWVSDQPGVVEVRVVAADTGVALNNATDWQAVTTETFDLTFSLRTRRRVVSKPRTPMRRSNQMHQIRYQPLPMGITSLASPR